MGAASSAGSGAMSGAAAGSALGPYGTIIGGAVGGLAGLVGGMSASSDLQKARRLYGEKAQMGIDQMRAGRSEAQSNYAPIIAGGKSSYQQAQDLVAKRKQAAQPGYNPITADSADPYLAKMSDYGQRQSQQAMQASALAKGGMGGGFLKALSNNAQDYAATKYQQAQQMAQGANAQNFGQEQQIYGNQTAYDQSQIGNTQANANAGLAGLSNYSGLAANYDSGVNNAYENWGASDAGILGSIAKNTNDTAQTTGSGLAGMAAGAADYFGKKKAGKAVD